MLCPLCETPFEPGRLFCMNCGETSPEGARVMGLHTASDPTAPLPASEQTVEVRPAAKPVARPTSVSRSTSFSAVVSLVLGCLAWLGLPVIGALGAVVSGHLARREIRVSGGHLDGGGIALTGLVLGYAQIALIVAAIVAITAIALVAVALH